MNADEGGDPKSRPTANGDPHLESVSIATQGKRKRSAQEERSTVESSSSTSREKTNLHESLRSLVDLLLKHDSDLQLLSCPFPVSAAKPRAKRAKVSNDQDTSNIKSRVDTGRYNTLQEFLADIERASAAVIERNQSQSNGMQPDGKSLNEVVSRIAVFKKHMNSLIGQSFVNQADVKTESAEDDAEEQVLPLNVGTREDKQALTLFGGSQSNPKQLFSSLQKSVKVPLPSSDSDLDKFVEVQEELREGVLPNGISTTRVIPYNLDANPPAKRTFGEVFGPRPGQPVAEPPRRRSSRSTSASWIDPFDLAFDTKHFLGERNNYCLTPLPSGQWLQYGGVTSSPSLWSRAAKHKTNEGVGLRHGDPALWTGEDTSLFQGVYSSFAPSFDSSGSVVQVDSKDLVWWSKRGAKRLRTLLSIPYQDEEAVTVQPGSIGDLDESTLEEMVQTFNPEEFKYNPLSDTTNKEELGSKELDELLLEISESLKTLNSYQKIRKDNIAFSGDDGSDTKETSATDFGTPDNPSDAERAVYETLRLGLTSIISSLPPYVLSKIDGDQLAELNISQKIIIENPDYNGIMDKDDYTLHRERAVALAAQSNAANRTSTPSASRPSSFQGTHSTYNQRAFSSNSQLSQSQGRFQVPAQGRQPSTTGTFTPSYAGARPPSTPQGSGYSQANPQYSQSNNVNQYQRPIPNGYTPYTARQGQPSQPFIPRSGQTAPYNATPQGRTPYAPAGSAQRFQYTNQSSSQGTYSNAATAAAARAAAEQAGKAQLAIQQARQSPSTPQSQFDARQSQEGSLTPGSKPNGTPGPS